MNRSHVFGYTPRPVAQRLSRKGIDDLHNRIILVLATLSLALVCVIARIGLFGVNSGLSNNKSRTPYTEGLLKRPDIFDVNGELLATTISTLSLSARGISADEVESLSKQLSQVFPKKSIARLRKNLSKGPGFIWIARHITPSQHAAILKLGNPKLELINDSRRFYPHGRLFSHVLGFTNVDSTGISGLEHTIDKEKLYTEGVHLSMDTRFQEAVYEELSEGIAEFGAQAGNAIVLDVKTGQVKAMVSLPDFNPHNSKDRKSTRLFNRNTTGVYEMGSTLKVFNTAMSLETGAAHLTNRYKIKDGLKIGRFRVTDFRGKSDWVTVPQAFLHSSNVAMSLMAHEAGIETQRSFFEKLGFLKAMNHELPERGHPISPLNWTEASLATIAYGYGISITPLHLVKGVASIINNGIEVHPTFFKEKTKRSSKRLISDRVSRQLRALMRLTVTDGTCKKADVDSYVVIAKTGTANKRIGRTYDKENVDATFVGAVGSSVDDMRYVVLVMLDSPKRLAKTFHFNNAGWNAAPVASRIIRRIAPLGNIRPNRMETSSLHKQRLMKQVKYVAIGGD